jgi:hypothetical protein
MISACRGTAEVTTMPTAEISPLQYAIQLSHPGRADMRMCMIVADTTCSCLVCVYVCGDFCVSKCGIVANTMSWWLVYAPRNMFLVSLSDGTRTCVIVMVGLCARIRFLSHWATDAHVRDRYWYNTMHVFAVCFRAPVHKNAFCVCLCPGMSDLCPCVRLSFFCSCIGLPVSFTCVQECVVCVFMYSYASFVRVSECLLSLLASRNVWFVCFWTTTLVLFMYEREFLSVSKKHLICVSVLQIFVCFWYPWILFWGLGF